METLLKHSKKLQETPVVKVSPLKMETNRGFSKKYSKKAKLFEFFHIFFREA